MFSSAFLSISDGFVKTVENKKIVDYSKSKIIENFDYLSSVDCNQNSKTIFSSIMLGRTMLEIILDCQFSTQILIFIP